MKKKECTMKQTGELRSLTCMKEAFLMNELFILAWNAAVAHSKIYSEESKRKEFKQTMKNELEKLVKNYQNRIVKESDHLKNIEMLVRKAVEIDKKINFNIGASQKLLNLYLKYLWCAGLIKEPPHCPIDRLVLHNLARIREVNWTEIKSIDKYEELIDKLSKLSKSSSVAEWELSNYKRRNT